jgi:hypothetical protein
LGGLGGEIYSQAILWMWYLMALPGCGVMAMPILALLEREQAVSKGAAFTPEDLTAIIAAFESALKRLRISDRNAPMALLVAKTTLELAKEGERDPKRLSEMVLRIYRRT